MIALDRISQARAKRDASLGKVDPPLQGIPPGDLPINVLHHPRSVLTPMELKITEGYSVHQLLQALRNRKFSVEEVTKAFLRRAAVAHVATNCLTELLWDDAITRARQLDSLAEPRGALLGLPISIKEHLGHVGSNVTTNAGFVAWVGKQHGSTLIVDTLWDEGCVFHARTTLPQAAMALETHNNVYGRTLNPHNTRCTPGGSSGGEASLVAMRGSLLGIGTDIGGSFRVPAAHSGLYGFKPTSKRLSAKGIRHYDQGGMYINGTPGPLANDIESLELSMKVCVGAKPWKKDDTITELEWRPVTLTRRLKIAVQWFDGVVKPHPPMIRALTEVADACQAAGMQVVDWKCATLEHKRGWEILSSLYWVDGGEGLRKLLVEGNEPMLPLTKFVLDQQSHVNKLTTEKLSRRLCERDEFRAAYAAAWDATAEIDNEEVDVILCPPAFGAAARHDQSRYWGYSSIWNLLDYPAAVFPVTRVDGAQDKTNPQYMP